MFITTFYSFKGGVGRTLALMNVACELAKSGNRVLMVDFDLEAPGLDTIQHSPALSATPGVVEFVEEYVQTGMVPDAREFIYPVLSDDVEDRELWYSVTPRDADGGQLWVMPAGRQDESYAARLADIDWGDLYENREGFLMFEELKTQWRKQLKFDYVLIDSRTGHTDVAGICTRQLPDAVVLLFFPNEQNLRGAKQIVRGMREEPELTGRAPIDLVFVASNVPYLDDEESILRRRLTAFRKQLGATVPPLTIHHYDSLTLLERPVIVRDRPQTRLARQYRVLTARIRSLNAGDREGVLTLLREYERPSGREALADLHRRLDQIEAAHPGDGQILYQVGKIRSDLGQVSSALSLFEEARRMGFANPEVNLSIAETYQRLGEMELAGRSAHRVLYDSAANFTQVWGAIELLRVTHAHTITELVGSAAMSALPPEARVTLAGELDRSRVEREAAAALLSSLVHQAEGSEPWVDSARFGLALALMALGQLPTARAMLQAQVEQRRGGTGSIFNLAMADWAIHGQPSPNLFQRVLASPAVVDIAESANYQQCMALAHWVCGDIHAANESLDLARAAIRLRYSPEFSCWNYLRVEPGEFAEHLDALAKMFRGNAQQPEFIEYYMSESG